MPPVHTSLAGVTSTGQYSPFSFSSKIWTQSSTFRVTSLHLQNTANPGFFFLVFPPKKKDRPHGISSDHRLKQQRHALTDAPLVSRELCSAYKFYWQLFSQTSEIRLFSIPGQTPILLHLNFLNLITLVPFLLFKLLEELEMATFIVLRSTTGRKCCSSAT